MHIEKRKQHKKKHFWYINKLGKGFTYNIEKLGSFYGKTPSDKKLNEPKDRKQSKKNNQELNSQKRGTLRSF